MIKKNLLFNLIGDVWLAVIGIAFIPLYIKLLGTEGWGLVGFYITLAGVFSLLDFGIGAAVNRELARLSNSDIELKEANNLLKSFEIIYTGIALFIALIVLAGSYSISIYWLSSKSISPESIQYIVCLMGVLIALRWPSSIYFAGLNGIEEQGAVNIIKIGSATMTSVGVIVILMYVDSSIEAYFYWQILVNLTTTLVVRFVLWRKIKIENFRPKYASASIFSVWKFAASMSGIGILTSVLRQMDKIVISKMFNLEILGFYVLASSVANSINRLLNPVFTAVLPRMVKLVAQKNEIGLSDLYHKASQLMATIIIPLTAILAYFSEDLLMLWTQDSELSHYVAPLVSILVIGASLNSLLLIPFAVQLAYGWTKLALLQNFISLLIIVPLYYFLSNKYGIKGAALVLPIMMSFQLVSMQYFLHRKYLTQEREKWYMQSLIFPLITVVPLFLLLCRFVDGIEFGLAKTIYIFLISIVIFSISLYSTATTRHYIYLFFKKIYYRNTT